jgi:hypothetical protein
LGGIVVLEIHLATPTCIVRRGDSHRSPGPAAARARPAPEGNHCKTIISVDDAMLSATCLSHFGGSCPPAVSPGRRTVDKSSARCRSHRRTFRGQAFAGTC